MFDWLKRLFRRKPKDVPKAFVSATTRYERFHEVGRKPGPDIIGRQGGQKRNRVHVYVQPYGYPIRACDWVAVEIEDLGILGYCSLEGMTDRVRMLSHITGVARGEAVCKHCQGFVLGKRTSIGMENHGHGKGAP